MTCCQQFEEWASRATAEQLYSTNVCMFCRHIYNLERLNKIRKEAGMPEVSKKWEEKGER